MGGANDSDTLVKATAAEVDGTMASERHLYSGDAYLRLYPKLEKWMRVCACCGARGYDPAMPESVYPRKNYAADHLRRYFNPLGLDRLGRCESCRGRVNDDT
jgi:hypothetical protein